MHVCICMYTCICTHTCTHTHTHYLKGSKKKILALLKSIISLAHLSTVSASLLAYFYSGKACVFFSFSLSVSISLCLFLLLSVSPIFLFLSLTLFSLEHILLSALTFLKSFNKAILFYQYKQENKTPSNFCC